MPVSVFGPRATLAAVSRHACGLALMRTTTTLSCWVGRRPSLVVHPHDRRRRRAAPGFHCAPPPASHRQPDTVNGRPHCSGGILGRPSPHIPRRALLAAHRPPRTESRTLTTEPAPRRSHEAHDHTAHASTAARVCGRERTILSTSQAPFFWTVIGVASQLSKLVRNTTLSPIGPLRGALHENLN